MDVQELGQFESVYKPSKEVAFCWLRKQYVQLSTEENHTEIIDHANDSLRIWQAAKAQAVPEGFVLVPKEPTEKMIDAGQTGALYNITSESHHLHSGFVRKLEATLRQRVRNGTGVILEIYYNATASEIANRLD